MDGWAHIDGNALYDDLLLSVLEVIILLFSFPGYLSLRFHICCCCGDWGFNTHLCVLLMRCCRYFFVWMDGRLRIAWFSSVLWDGMGWDWWVLGSVFGMMVGLEYLPCQEVWLGGDGIVGSSFWVLNHIISSHALQISWTFGSWGGTIWYVFVYSDIPKYHPAAF